MFIGHYGVSFALRPQERPVPLWLWFVAVQWLDIVWSLLVLLGVEHLRVIPGFTQANALDLYDMPYTHGLPGALGLSLALGLAVALGLRGNRLKTFALVAAASFSHWILDLIVHVPDLPLIGNSHMVGLGLWRHVAISFPLELLLLGLGGWLYARSASFAGSKGRLAFWSFAALMAAMQVYANFGPPPASPTIMALMAIGFYALLAVLAALVERFATLPAGAARP